MLAYDVCALTLRLLSIVNGIAMQTLSLTQSLYYVQPNIIAHALSSVRSALGAKKKTVLFPLSGHYVNIIEIDFHQPQSYGDAGQISLSVTS